MSIQKDQCFLDVAKCQTKHTLQNIIINSKRQYLILPASNLSEIKRV